VSVPGTYDVAGTVTIVNRSSNGAAGYDQLVPLRTEGLGIVLVNRGFVPLATAPDSPVPSAPVTAVGYLRVTQTRGTLGAVDSTDPATVEFQRIDVPLISRKFGGTVFPLYLQLVAETPPTGADWPAPVAFPELSEGSHQSYVFQWSFFSLVAVAGWVVVVRRKWRAGAPVSGSPVRTSA
jgi:cytochrome oxidase assembly protein ShyY1